MAASPVCETRIARFTRSQLNRSANVRIFIEGIVRETTSSGDPSGHFESFGKLLFDLMDKRNGQLRFKALVNALDQAVVILRDYDGTITHWTAGCEELYGWTRAEAVGQQCQELLKTKCPIPFDQIQEQLRKTGSWKGEVEHFRRDGSRVFVATHWVLLYDEENEPLTVIESCSDITARVKAQEELQSAIQQLSAMTAELERSNQELEEFARIASHDLSAPLLSTGWLVELLARQHGKSLDDDGRQCLLQIRQGLDRMSDLVEAILSHARVGQHAILSREYTHAEDGLGEAIQNLIKHIEESGARIEYGSLPEVAVEPKALARLFQNILSNALKYRRPGMNPAITLAARPQGGMWLFCIEDNGIGIEPEWYERIFQPMQRRWGPEVAGSGIGLATCKKIVTRVGGRIWVESQVGAGSKFFFTLPGKHEGRQAPNGHDVTPEAAGLEASEQRLA